MAALIFFFGGKFRKCFPKGREVKHRIVAKSACTARRLQNFSLNSICDDGKCSPFLRQSNRANEIRRAFRSRLAAYLAQQFFNPLRVCRLQSSVSCGMYSRCAAECGHDKPRIVCEDEPVVQPRVMQRLARCVLRRRRSIFFKRGKHIEIRQQRQVNDKRSCGCCRQSAIFGKFAWVGRGEKKISGRAH